MVLPTGEGDRCIYGRQSFLYIYVRAPPVLLLDTGSSVYLFIYCRACMSKANRRLVRHLPRTSDKAGSAMCCGLCCTMYMSPHGSWRPVWYGFNRSSYWHKRTVYRIFFSVLSPLGFYRLSERKREEREKEILELGRRGLYLDLANCTCYYLAIEISFLLSREKGLVAVVRIYYDMAKSNSSNSTNPKFTI
jgi:hypothetical protein